MIPRDVLFVLRLSNQPLASVVVGLALTPAAVLDLEAREVGVGLDLLDERHLVQVMVGKCVRAKVHPVPC